MKQMVFLRRKRKVLRAECSTSSNKISTTLTISQGLIKSQGDIQIAAQRGTMIKMTTLEFKMLKNLRVFRKNRRNLRSRKRIVAVNMKGRKKYREKMTKKST